MNRINRIDGSFLILSILSILFILSNSFRFSFEPV
jgi:hypothetical protein